MHKSLYGDIICCFDLQAEVSLRNLFFVVLHSLVSLACILTSVSGMVGGGISSHKPIFKKKSFYFRHLVPPGMHRAFCSQTRYMPQLSVERVKQTSKTISGKTVKFSSTLLTYI